MMSDFRIEHDSMGEVRLPYNAYYGAQTQRAVENLTSRGQTCRISGRTIPPALIHTLGLVKWAAAKANDELGLLTSGRSPLTEQETEALLTASLEVADGKFDDQFPVDVYQTGSGTSSNMNTNEVIANRAIELCGGDRFAPEKRIHPNDHVNMGQSTNDIFPTAVHAAVTMLCEERLLPAMRKACAVLEEKSQAWQNILKIGRTHLADATPMTLGQEFSGFHEQMAMATACHAAGMAGLHRLPAGGTAVGTGINTHPEFGRRVAAILTQKTKILFQEAENHFAANAQRDGLVAWHACLKSAAVTVMNIANNIRWLGSGPRCGFYEIKIPDLQPGSSIMPGKVNPVLCEALMQACAKVIGNDQTMTVCGAAGGQFQLNIMMPVMADTAIESVSILAGALEIFTEKCLAGLEANAEKCREGVEKSLSMVTALNPYLGYDHAAALAKEAFQTGKTIRELCTERQILDSETLEQALDPMKMTRPQQ
ncbi:MAG: class II fumarate hydratase [Planctomycetaceae bacterium]|jgi:fumarate hydratase class II|nr:class II fumarate hydratase [Planctomycetaceae bacterium]